MKVILTILSVCFLTGCSQFSTGQPIVKEHIPALNEWESGTTPPPTSGTFTDGQKYVNTISGDIYEYTVSGNVWVIVDNINSLPH